MITMNVDTLSFELSSDGTVWDHLACSPINALMISGNNKLNTRILFEPTSNGTCIARLEVDMPGLMNPQWHMLAYHAIQAVIGNHGHLEFLVNQHCGYRYIPAEGIAGMIDSEVFKEPVLKCFESTLTGTEKDVDNPEFVASLYKGSEVKVDVVEEGEPDVVEEEPRRPRDRPIREQMAKMGEQLDTLEKIHRHLITVYPSDNRDEIGICFEYEGINYLVNVVEGEEDLAAVMAVPAARTIVGIFLHDNIFVTKGYVRKSTTIDCSAMSAYDFNALMVNYSVLYELHRGASTRQRITRRERDRGTRRGSRERGNHLD